MPAGYNKEQLEQVMQAAYEIYKIDRKSINATVDKFTEENPWAEEHKKLVLVYIRTFTDYSVLCELPDMNAIRLRNSLVTSLDKLHKQLYSYRPDSKENTSPADEDDDLFNPTGD